MRDTLPTSPNFAESGVVNLDKNSGGGTHWTAYKKLGNTVQYFDSYGDLKPPIELMQYFRGSEIRYNYENHQKQNKYNCGHLCLKFLASI